MAVKLLKVGGLPVVDAIASLGGLITLIGLPSGVTSGNYQSFFLPDGTNYQVTAGKNLYIVQATVYGTAVNTGPSQIGYGDVASGNSASSPTGWKAITGSFLAPAANTPRVDFPWWKFPATKFPTYQQSAGGGTITLLGFEE